MHTVEVYPLMIRCNDFCVSGASWYRHRQPSPGSSMTGFLGSRFRRMCEKGKNMKEFFLLSSTIRFCLFVENVTKKPVACVASI